MITDDEVDVSGRAMPRLVEATRRAAGEGTVPRAMMFSESGNTVDAGVLVKAPEIFAAMRRLISGAEREVLIQEFYWESGCDPSDQLVAGLQDLQSRREQLAADEPVHVYAVLNHHWLLVRHARRDFERDVARAGLDPRWVAVHVAPFTQRLFGNLHTKSFVVDGKRALVTSANAHAPQNQPAPWYELGYLVSGPVAGSLRADFEDVWSRAARDSLPSMPVDDDATGAVTPCLVVTRRANGNPFRRSTTDPAAQAFLTAFEQARRHIRILTPHLNNRSIRRSLLDAARRGVRLEIVLAKGKGRKRVMLPLQGGTNIRNVRRLHRAVRREPEAHRRLDIRWHAVDGTPVVGDGPNALHAKYATVDSEVAVVGSSNLDDQAIHYSREVNVVVDDATVVAAWDERAFLPVFESALPAR